MQQAHDRVAISLEQDLRAADNEFKRNPVAGIYELYKQYVAMGQYPYIENVTDYIKAQYSLPEDVTKQLHHEVYLASNEAHRDRDAARATDMQAQGYVRATTATLQEGKRYELRRYSESIFGADLQPVERVRCSIDAEGTYFLMPLRNRRCGYPMFAGREYWVREVSA